MSNSMMLRPSAMLDREPLPAAMDHGVEVAVLAIEPHRARDLDAPCRRASACRWRPCAAASSSTCSRRTRSRGACRRSAAPAATWRRRWSSSGRGSTAGSGSVMWSWPPPPLAVARWPGGKSSARSYGPRRNRRHPELEQRAVLVAVAGHVGHGAVRHLEAMAIEEPSQEPSAPPRRRCRSSRTPLRSSVSSVKTKKHASTPNRRPSAVARCPVQYHHCTGFWAGRRRRRAASGRS